MTTHARYCKQSIALAKPSPAAHVEQHSTVSNNNNSNNNNTKSTMQGSHCETSVKGSHCETSVELALNISLASRYCLVCYTYLLEYCTIAIDTGPSTIELALDISSESQCCLVHYMHLPKYCAIAIDTGPSTIELPLDISSEPRHCPPRCDPIFLYEPLGFAKTLILSRSLCTGW